jgi:5-methylcytosine-specific restriction endonuclease McrA
VEGIKLEHIAEWVDKTCPYCDEPISIYDLECDHIVPMTRKENEYTPEEKAILTADSNITGCHKACNRAKGSLDGIEFLSLLRMLNAWETECKIHKDVVFANRERITYPRYSLSPFNGSKQYILTKLKAAALKYYGGKK